MAQPAKYWNTSTKWKEWSVYDNWLASNFGYMLDRLKNVSDEHGPLLDNTMLLFGSACSTTHNARNYPLIVAGGKNMGLKHGSYQVFDDSVPLSNLYVSMLNTVGVQTDRFADSTGSLKSDVFSS